MKKELLDNDAGHSRRLIRWGFWISTAIVAVFAMLAINKSIWESGINEIGDAVAGFASCLAFLWVIITIQLQIKELEHQRKELAESTAANNRQASELEESRKLATDQLEISRVDQKILLTNFLRSEEERAAYALLNHLVLEIAPVLVEKSYGQGSATFHEKIERQKQMMGGSLVTALTQVGNIFYEYDVVSHSASAKERLTTEELVREKCDLLVSLILGMHMAGHQAGASRQMGFQLPLYLIEASCEWLLEGRKSLPTATERFQKQTEELLKRLDESGAEIRESFKHAATEH